MLRDSVRHLVAWTSVRASRANPTDNDVATLKAQLAEQQKQIDALKSAMDEQKKLIEKATSARCVAGQHRIVLRCRAIRRSATWPAPRRSFPRLHPPPCPALSRGQPHGRGDAIPATALWTRTVPPYLRAVAFASRPSALWTATYRLARQERRFQYRKSISAAFLTTTWSTENLTEDRFSPQNSRIGFRVDGDWKGAHFIGYNEFDFLGTSGIERHQQSPMALSFPACASTGWTCRKGGWEFLAGQSWSMLTPNRKGISPLPGDLFYSQVMDVNYMAGLTWTRQPGFACSLPRRQRQSDSWLLG